MPHTARLPGPGDSHGEGASLPTNAPEPPILSGGPGVGGFLVRQFLADLTSKPSAFLCSAQSMGSFASNRLTVSCLGWWPSRIASTMSGASQATPATSTEENPDAIQA